VTYIVDTKPHAQIELYNTYGKLAVGLGATWLLVVDLDEFMFATSLNVCHGTIASVLASPLWLPPWV
jgi:hypothetical protein